MFDFLRNKFEKAIKYSQEEEAKIKQDIFNILIDGEVNYDLALIITDSTIAKMRQGIDYKKALQETIKDNINATHGQLEKGIVLLVGFQGHGKTTTAHKLAYFLKKNNFTVAVTTTDTHRTAAEEQLTTNLTRFNIPFISTGGSLEQTCDQILREKYNYDYLIVDTAGINYTNAGIKENELERIIAHIKPKEVVVIINTLLGHSLFSLLSQIRSKIRTTGAIMTNVDGDKKGGSFLSFYYMMKLPIYYISNGEQVQNFEQFNANSITNTLLGELDLDGLSEVIKNNVSKSVEDVFMNDVIGKGIFTIEHFLLFTEQTSKIGVGRIATGLGIVDPKLQDTKQHKDNIAVIKSVIQSMTNKEKHNQVKFTPSRLQRIAKGSGRLPEMVSQVILSYEKTKQYMLQISQMLKSGNGNMEEMMKMLKGLVKNRATT